MVDSSRWGNIPAELQALPIWCIANENKAPCLIGQNGLYNASPVTGPWHTFEDACIYAAQLNKDIGFIVPVGYTVIDLDVKDFDSRDKFGQELPLEQLTPNNTLDEFASMVTIANSYAELSQSGKGIHIIVKADIGAGKKSQFLEIYSRDRFMISTGNTVAKLVYVNALGVVVPLVKDSTALPIEERQAFASNIADNMTTTQAKTIELEEVEQVHTDEEIWRMGVHAENASKFIDLCAGNWQQLGYPSQSEADNALLSMFTFYTKSNEQVRRLFRETELGQRAKAAVNDVYLNRTLRHIRSREAKEAEIAVVIDTQSLMENSRIRNEANKAEHKETISTLQQEYIPTINEEHKPPDIEGLEWPPGFTGVLAGYIYSSSPRPVKEVAITAALGLIAGLAGKGWHTPSKSGLNLYIILVARSAIGKESMHSGISSLQKQTGTSLDNFINFNDFVSGPALVKACEKTKSFVNISGEWGRKLRRLAYEEGRDGPMQQLRTVMTNLYQKSGPDSTVGGATYSANEKDINSVKGGVAYSMIGETTPGTFYESLTQSMMEDGFLSRFTVIKYEGERPAANPNTNLQLDKTFTGYLTGISMAAARHVSHNTSQMVSLSPEAVKIFSDFDLYCDNEIIASGMEEMERQMWNRAHLKALRVACLLAVAENHGIPVVTKADSDWAIYLIMKDINIMKEHIKDGDIGIDDSSRMRKLINLLKDYLTKPVPKSYKIDERLVAAGIIPRKYLHTRTSSLSSFSKHRLGATISLEQVIKAAVVNGYIVEVDKHAIIKDYAFHGQCFKAVNLPD